MKYLAPPALLIATLALGACATVSVALQEAESSIRGGAKAVDQPAKDVPRYGAIAFSDSSLRWRFRWNVPAQQRATDLALKDCGDADCRILLTFGPQMCGTFAMGRNGKTAAVARPTVKEAEAAARSACDALTSGCKVAPAQCNT